jgi:hypothetical protein
VEEVAMSTILKSNCGYITAAIVAVLFLFPAVIPTELRFVLGLICLPVTIIFVLVKVCGGEPTT